MTEVFIEPELENLADETIAAEWFETVSKLGLEEQVKLADKSETKQAPPYAFIDPKTSRIIRTVCPCRVDYKAYNVSTIPLDILQEIAKCEENKWYHKIYICYDDKSPDPFVVGKLKDEWGSPMHMIARWGAELLPFEQLELKAVERLKYNAKKALERLRLQAQFGLDDVDGFVKSLMSGEQPPNFDFTVDEVSRW